MVFFKKIGSSRHTFDVVTYHAGYFININQFISSLKKFDLLQKQINIIALEVTFKTKEELTEVLEFDFLHAAVISCQEFAHKDVGV